MDGHSIVQNSKASKTVFFKKRTAMDRSGCDRSMAVTWREHTQLLVEHKLLRVQQRPEDILVADLCLLGMSFEVCESRLFLLGGRKVCKGPEEQVVNLD